MFQLMPVFEVMILLMSFPKCLKGKVLTFRFYLKVTVLALMFKLVDFHKKIAHGRLPASCPQFSTAVDGHGCGATAVGRLGCGRLQPRRPLADELNSLFHASRRWHARRGSGRFPTVGPGAAERATAASSHRRPDHHAGHTATAETGPALAFKQNLSN